MGRVRVRGADLYYEETGRGPPILLIPPSGATASTWGRLVDELAALGRVITYDRRGYSRTGGPIVRSAVVHTTDAAALLEAMCAGPATVVGTSAGATIALDLAVRRPDLVHAVVAHEAPWRALLHPDPSGVVTLARMTWLASRERYDAAAEVLLRWVYGYFDGGSAWDAFPDSWRHTARQHGECVVADLCATIGSYPPRIGLANMTTPAVCSYGSRSRGYMHAVTRALAGAIPTATLRVVADAGHAAPFDAPIAFAALIGDAMRSAKPLYTRAASTSSSTSSSPSHRPRRKRP